MINSRNLTDLSPEAEAICRAHIAACHAAGIELLITSTYRDAESQAGLYAIGRTVQITRPRVTDAKPGQSWHNYRVAWDVVPLIGGKCVWSTTDPLWSDVIRIAQEVGAARGPKWELAHFQCLLPAGMMGHDGAPTQAAMDLFPNAGTLFV